MENNIEKKAGFKIGVIGAEQQEIDLLLEKISITGNYEYAGMPFYEGEIYGTPVVVARCGVGKVNAAMCVQVLSIRFGVSCIINSGSAGGTDNRLSVLDMVVSTDVVFHDVDVQVFGYAPGQVPGTKSPFFTADSAMRKSALKVFSLLDESFFAGLGEDCASVSGKRLPAMVEGRIASGDIFVSDAGLRRNIISRFSPACVEMEGAAVAQACSANGIPFLILRCVSDLAGDDAGMPYQEFSRRASIISAAVVLGMLEKPESWRNGI